MLKIKYDINQQYLKTVDLHFFKSEYFSLTWSCGSRQRDTISSGWKFKLNNLAVKGLKIYGYLNIDPYPLPWLSFLPIWNTCLYRFYKCTKIQDFLSILVVILCFSILKVKVTKYRILSDKFSTHLLCKYNWIRKYRPTLNAEQRSVFQISAQAKLAYFHERLQYFFNKKYVWHL